MENQWLSAAKRLHALAETGKEFTKDEYDLERYEEISTIALQLLASLGETPIEVISHLVGAGSKGYVTPKVDVRGAVFRDNRLLLVREKTDGLWTLPGGYADVGLSPRENIEKEIYEEAGIKVQAKRLYSLRHKAKGEYDPDARDFYKLFFLCDAENASEAIAGAEISEAAYFSRTEIPPLSTGRIVASDLVAAWDAFSRSESPARFD